MTKTTKTKDAKDYVGAADWAENAMALKPNSGTARRGADAAAFGRDLLEQALGGPDGVEKALGGRPALDPESKPGEHARIRHVRLGTELDARLASAERAESRKASDIMRAALDQYLPKKA